MIAGHLLFTQPPPGAIASGVHNVHNRVATIPYRFITYQPATAENSRTATITLAQPEAGNRIDEGLAEEFRDACRRIDEDEQAGLVVVTGAGDCFSVGRQSLERGAGAGEAEPPAEQLRARLARLRVADALANLTIPTLVALNGDAIGHGLELALAGDLRIAAAPARFGLAEPGRLSFPWDGGTQRLPRLIGPAWALDLALTGRLVDSDTALRLGLVNRVTPAAELAEETARLAQTILAGGPVAARYAKEAVGQGMDLSLAQGLRLEADLSIILQSTADRAEGIASFREKRPPRFGGS